MKKQKERFLSMLLCLMAVLVIAAACQKNEETKEGAQENVQEQTQESAQEETQGKTEKETAGGDSEVIRLGVLKGPTGIGASYLLEKNANNESLNHYEATIEAEATDMVSQVISGQVDIAAVPTNAALTLYNKTEGQVQLLALNTAGVLYILENGDTVQSVGDLKGKTIHAVGQGANPEYVLKYILSSNHVVPDSDVTIEFLDSAELTTKMTNGDIEVCMLPVPAVTTVLMKNSDVRIALDMTKEWDNLNNGSKLTMGCVVVNKTFAEEHEKAVADFLKEYEESVNYAKESVEDAAALCEKYEIVPKAQIAAKAIPDSNLIFVSGSEMKDYISGYYEVLADADIKSIGGKLPNDDFYYAK